MNKKVKKSFLDQNLSKKLMFNLRSMSAMNDEKEEKIKFLVMYLSDI